MLICVAAAKLEVSQLLSHSRVSQRSCWQSWRSRKRGKWCCRLGTMSGRTGVKNSQCAVAVCVVIPVWPTHLSSRVHAPLCCSSSSGVLQWEEINTAAKKFESMLSWPWLESSKVQMLSYFKIFFRHIFIVSNFGLTCCLEWIHLNFAVVCYI